ISPGARTENVAEFPSLSLHLQESSTTSSPTHYAEDHDRNEAQQLPSGTVEAGRGDYFRSPWGTPETWLGFSFLSTRLSCIDASVTVWRLQRFLRVTKDAPDDRALSILGSP